MTIKELHGELDMIITSLNASEFNTVESEVLQRLEDLCVSAKELGLTKGKNLIENLVNVIKAIQEGKSKAESGILRLTALEFYVKNLQSGTDTEEL